MSFWQTVVILTFTAQAIGFVLFWSLCRVGKEDDKMRRERLWNEEFRTKED